LAEVFRRKIFRMAIWQQNLLTALCLALFAFGLAAYMRTERWRRAWRRIRRDKLGMISLCVLAGYFAVGLLDLIALPSAANSGRSSVLDLFFKNTPQERGYSAPLAKATYAVTKAEPLKGRHLFGTNLLGQDVLQQTLKGCSTALTIGGLTSLIYLPVGAILGIAAGYYRRWVDDIIQYLYSTIASIPGILLLIAILMTFPQRKAYHIAIALSVTQWVGLCRLIRGETLRQAARPYTEAARSLGQRNGRIILFHILPNVMHLVVINLVLGFSGLALAEATLSYLGVGVPVGTASWGVMIDAGRMELSREPVVWWNLMAATGAVFFLVLSLNLFGDALRRALDPKAV
jgi:peptide/nickel transport system permease protein